MKACLPGPTEEPWKERPTGPPERAPIFCMHVPWGSFLGAVVRAAWVVTPVFRPVAHVRHGCRARGFSWPPHRPLTALCPFRGSMTPLCSAQPPQSEAGRLIQQVELDRSAFKEPRLQPALKVPASQCHEVISRLSRHIFRTKRLRCVVLPEDSGGRVGEGERLILVKTQEGAEGGPTGLPPEVASFVKETGTPVVEFPVVLQYEDLNMEQVLRRVLPAGMEVPSSFESAGHIARLNLRPEALPYKRLIAEVLLDKNPRIRTVVNKLDLIESKFRTFPLEVLAGEDRLDVELKEGPAKFRFNFSEVYWNSRLQGEHGRIASLIPANATVCDVFAGVGPFAVPLAIKGCRVYANDLNDRSYHYLQINAEINKVSDRIVASNLDGRGFIEAMAEAKVPVQHFIMNLPGSAIEFLDALHGRFEYLKEEGHAAPMVHVHCFSKADDPVADAVQCASASFGEDLSGRVSVHHVRDVAPRKPMLCLSFPLW